MNIRLNELCLAGSLALMSVLARPVQADEWNKKTEFQFSGPVEIPGRVLTPGKYVFQLMDSESDRNIVQIFSEDSQGKDTFVANVMAIPDYVAEASDKAAVHFEERQSGLPQAIHSWFYPGENTGWEFIYSKGKTMDTAANITPVSAPVTAATTPNLPASPRIRAAESPRDPMDAVEEEVLVAQNDLPAPPATPDVGTQNGSYGPMLPETAGYSGLELITGLVMLGGGIGTVLALCNKSQA